MSYGALGLVEVLKLQCSSCHDQMLKTSNVNFAPGIQSAEVMQLYF